MNPPPGRITLYHYDNSPRSQIVNWYLSELCVDFEIHEVNMADKEHRNENFLAINPFGKLPALKCGDTILFESGAILLFLAEIVDNADTPEKRAELNKWILFANSTMPELKEKEMPKCMQPLENILSKQEYLLGDFSAADIAVGSILLYVRLYLNTDLSAYRSVEAYIRRLQARAKCTIKPPPAK